MGVPAFFRWLTRKYPSVIVNCIEQKSTDINGEQIPIDASEPNPNGVEFDNLYLDMNGIIHPCTHPENKPAPKNEDEMMVAIFECIDRLFRIVRPRKLLYMAIDGVAPRAKMNQQRSRRFRASKETTEKAEEVARVRQNLLEAGAILPPEKPKGEHFDSNCITPGTPFMDNLSACLHYYIHDRLNNDPGWKGIKVILSDANVPGEGEHKIMDYIRKQRAQPNHDPNTQHVLCGADADLIMLGLATHEPNFTIIREEFKPNQPRPCDMCGQMGHEMKDCQGLEQEVFNDGSSGIAFSSDVQFIFVRLNVLREYLERELEMPNLPFEYEFERAIDDWVFMCFFVGNDFLPHLPSLEIRENAIDRLVALYKKTVYKTGGFLTLNGDVNLDRVQLIMSDLGLAEDEIFKKRQQTEKMFADRNKFRKRREKREKLQRSNSAPNFVLGGQYQPMAPNAAFSVANPKQTIDDMRRQSMGNDNNQGQKRKREDDDSSEEEQTPDEVRLWEDGFKERYYESKFDVDRTNSEFRHSVALEYVRGLCWVLQYYYQGCPSWKWYFPYHYAPFASDFANIASVLTKFEKGTKPFRPLEQLMSVFPAASSKHVPQPWAILMSDPESPIIDFYPVDFKIDLNGKKFAWQGVALLPFVDEGRLHKALEPYYDMLTPEEIRRNVRGSDRLYIQEDNSKYGLLKDLHLNKDNFNNFTSVLIDGMEGKVKTADDCVKIGGSLPSPVMGLNVIRSNKVICVKFEDPIYGDDYVYEANRLKGVVEPPRVLKPKHMSEENSRSWRPRIGMTQPYQRGRLDVSGHRTLSHYVPRNPGQYNAVPPPQRFSSRNNSWQPDYNNSRRPNHNQGYNSQQLNQNNYSQNNFNSNNYRNNTNFPNKKYNHSSTSSGLNPNYSTHYSPVQQQASNNRTGYFTGGYQANNSMPRQAFNGNTEPTRDRPNIRYQPYDPVTQRTKF
ncbi:5'-3' exoribonuclease 2 homolog isoform X2 [Adelges cooleyi]|uniref:5'-3' exoribonuclease 2 homolog isoform X2 n=1 Tax=Adelges cooleyi TaxID=133065 RepID=UPI00218063D5|nr:5'-3' exoribonuclease 2 homolog isoform X2 [Adelges cooleyi]